MLIRCLIGDEEGLKVRSMKQNTTQNLLSSLSSLPNAIGVYLFKDINEKVLYVGKATSLIKRVRSYFASNNTWKARQLLQYANKIDYILTASENEALILECNLIKTHCPRYNVLLKDDKAYPYIKITLNEDYPRMLVVRKTKDDGAAYFGPYTNTSAMRRTMKMIREIFPIRDCKQKIKPSITKRPCLNYHIKRCAGPCAQKIDMEGYRRIVKEVCLFLEGKMDSLLIDMTERMKKEAVLLRFEQAAGIRDQLKDIERFMARQRVVVNKPVDLDVICVVEDRVVCGIVLLIRSGRMIGQEHFILDVPQGESAADATAAFIKQYYHRALAIPPEIITGCRIQEQEALINLLSEKAGKRVKLCILPRGYKKELIDMAKHNAEFILKQKGVTPELSEVKALLNLKNLPLRIEAFDISNISGKMAVGSMVVFVNGRPETTEYRKFKIKGEFAGQDDFGMIEEVVRRRYKRVLTEDIQKPDLIMVDGGKGQLNAAFKVLSLLGLEKIPLISLSKPAITSSSRFKCVAFVSAYSG
ncbi:excinuclease ABC subunit UvrC [Candidatus Desantisbacteria bacterium]|nr:excinuclease ABC subunit UvrC [Candidatus Desantisbacteria bacterium]